MYMYVQALPPEKNRHCTYTLLHYTNCEVANVPHTPHTVHVHVHTPLCPLAAASCMGVAPWMLLALRSAWKACSSCRHWRKPRVEASWAGLGGEGGEGGGNEEKREEEGSGKGFREARE